MPHTDSTFLPPLINRYTGKEIHFPDIPQPSFVDMNYGNSEIGRCLTLQYPPIFHAAKNVPSFIKAFQQMPNLTHLRVITPNQEPEQRYRKCIIDYALISLRIAIERAHLPALEDLTLAVHPGALLYLNPTTNYGASPKGLKRWRQIRSLALSLDSWPFGTSASDHLMLLLAYLRTMSNTVEHLTFHWHGRRGPCPLTLNLTPSHPRSSSSTAEHFAEVISAMSLPATPATAFIFPKLERLSMRNTWVCAASLAVFSRRHAQTLKRLDLENVILASGTWDEALEPLMRANGRDGGASWELRQSGSYDEYYLPQPKSAPGSPNAQVDRKCGEEVIDELWPAVAGVGDNYELEENTRRRLRCTSPHVNSERRRCHRAPRPLIPPSTLKSQAGRSLSKLKRWLL